VIKRGGSCQGVHDIVTGETCVPSSLDLNNLGEAAVLHFPLLWPELCQSQSTDKYLWKAAELHLALLISSSYRLLINHSPQTHPKILKKGAGFTDPRGKERESMFSV
jgi:hypothetical protein